MRENFTRFGAFLLCMALILPCISCFSRKREEAPPQSDQRLVVEDVAVVYADAFAAAAAARTAELAARAVLLFEGLLLDEAEKNTLAKTVQAEYFPVLCHIPIYEEELTDVLEHAEAFLARWEREGATDAERVPALLELYQDLVGVLGTERAGALGYEAELWYLDSRIALCEARYEEYGYPWYLEEREVYQAKRTVLTERLGREVFSAAAGVAVFAGLLVSSALTDTVAMPDERLLSDGDLLLLLRRQGTVFANAAVTAEQWSLLVDLLVSELPKAQGTLLQDELNALRDAAYFTQLAVILPEIFDFYHVCLDDLSVDEIGAFRQNEDTVAKIAVICRVLSEHETAFFALLERFAALGSTSSAAELEALRAAGQYEAYQAFLAEHPMCTAQELIAAVAACGTDASKEAMEALNRKTIGYLCGIAPYLTFALAAEVAMQ